MTPWLLLIIAALIVGCVSLYFRLQQVESHSLGRQAVVADELREAEAALLSALEKVRQMDAVLANRLVRSQLGSGPDASRVETAEPLGLPWRGAAVELARTGMTAREIARELELPVGQVELVLALETAMKGSDQLSADSLQLRTPKAES